jgi:hypothetical protein
MNPESADRDATLRRLLVATVDAGPARRRARWMLPVASIGAFALAGALTAGALVSVRTADTDAEPVDLPPASFIYADAQILGTPIAVASSTTTTIDLGTPPAGADNLAISLHCLEPGVFTQSFDGGPWFSGYDCSDSDGGGGGAGGYQPFAGDAPRSLTVTVESGRFAVWIAWVDVAEDPEPSAEYQAALADGVVTREEYLAGFERYVTCLADAGYALQSINTESEIIDYAIPGDVVDSGVEHQCYQREFFEIDSGWQIAHPQQSEEQLAAFNDGVVSRAEYLAAFDRFVECLAPLGVTVDVVDRAADVLDYAVDASAAQPGGSSNRCYAFEFFNVETAWRDSVGG